MEPLIHFIVPFTILTFLEVRVKKALPIALLALLPDLDALLRVHRSPSHSLIVVLLAALLFLIFYGLLPRLGLVERVPYTSFGLGLLSVMSHLFLDLFSYYIPLLWPIYGRSLWIQTGLVVYIGGHYFPRLRLADTPTAFRLFSSLDAPLFTSEGLIISAMLLLPVLLRPIIRYYREHYVV